MFACPKNIRATTSRSEMECDCCTEIQQQTGINPEIPGPSGLRRGSAPRQQVLLRIQTSPGNPF
jgi:hypothetical protein